MCRSIALCVCRNNSRPCARCRSGRCGGSHNVVIRRRLHEAVRSTIDRHLLLIKTFIYKLLLHYIRNV